MPRRDLFDIKRDVALSAISLGATDIPVRFTGISDGEAERQRLPNGPWCTPEIGKAIREVGLDGSLKLMRDTFPDPDDQRLLAPLIRSVFSGSRFNHREAKREWLRTRTDENISDARFAVKLAFPNRTRQVRQNRQRGD